GRLLLDGGGVRADAGDPQAPDARAPPAQRGVRRDGLLARGVGTAAAGDRSGAHLAGRQGGREDRRRDLGGVRRGAGFLSPSPSRRATAAASRRSSAGPTRGSRRSPTPWWGGRSSSPRTSRRPPARSSAASSTARTPS